MIADSREEEDRRHETMINLSPMRAMGRRVSGDSAAEGQAMVEYSLIFVLIIIVCFSIVTALSSQIDQKLFQVLKTIANAMS